MKKLFFTLMVMTIALPSFSFATTSVDDTICDSNHTVPVVAASYDPEPGVSGILLTWDMINDSDFAGYKVVISKNDSTPSYPSNGYLYFTTDKTTTGWLVNNAAIYNNGDFGSKLTIGENYYFSVTALYTCNGSTTYVPGNVLYMTYRGGYLDIVKATTVNISTTVTRVNWQTIIGSEGQYRYAKSQSELDVLPWRTDGVSNDPNITENFGASQVDLTGLQTETTYFIQLRKSLGSGSNITYGPVKNLSFISGSLGAHSANLDVVDTRVDLIKSDSARVYWRSTIAAEGYFRYATSLDALATQAWSSIGVSNGPAVTGNMTGSMVSLFLLQPNTKYYIELKKAGGTEGNSGYVYGNPTIINFTTNSPGVEGTVEGTYVADLNIAKTRVDQIKLNSARVYWQVINMSSDGYYRYATSTDALAGLPWINTGVLNGPEATGNYNASMVTLNNLQPFTKYYIEVKSVAGIAGEVSYRYGNPTTINFTTLSGNEVTDNTKVKVCHVVGNGKTNTLEIAKSALAAHLAHGDKEGTCLQPLIDNNPGVVKPGVKVDAGLVNRVRGRILLQVENNGEAWYVNPRDDKRFYLKDGLTAYSLMREAGLGISNVDLAKIPVGFEDRFNDTDTDGDGLADKLESGLGTDPNKIDTDGDGVKDKAEILVGTNPLGTGTLSSDNSLVNRLRGRIVLQVQSRGEAWYIDPADGKRYYMRDGEAAYQIMRFRSLGITDSDLSKIAE